MGLFGSIVINKTDYLRIHILELSHRVAKIGTSRVILSYDDHHTVRVLGCDEGVGDLADRRKIQDYEVIVVFNALDELREVLRS